MPDEDEFVVCMRERAREIFFYLNQSLDLGVFCSLINEMLQNQEYMLAGEPQKRTSKIFWQVVLKLFEELRILCPFVCGAALVNFVRSMNCF